jgi:hypothetical protein
MGEKTMFGTTETQAAASAESARSMVPGVAPGYAGFDDVIDFLDRISDGRWESNKVLIDKFQQTRIEKAMTGVPGK